MRRSVTRVAVLCWFCGGILGGIFLSKVWPIAFSVWWLLTLVPCCVLLGRRTGFNLVLIGLIGLLIGLQRGGQLQSQLAWYHQWHGRHVVVEGRIHDDPSYDDKRRLDFRLDHVRIADHSLPGRVRVRALSGNARRGDEVRVTGKLQPGFGNYQGSISFATLQVTKKNSDMLDTFRQRFFVGVYNALPDPQASLGLGFLVGLRAQLPDSLQAQMQALALTHIVVASGYNLTVVIRLARRLLARYSKFQAFAGAWLLMWIMLLITGISPSMSRAAVVTGCALLAWYYGRKVHPGVLLLGGAGMTAWWNPLYPWSDLGWWLSFLAFAGVLLVAPLLTHLRYGQRSPPLLGQIAIETLAAQLLVAPLIMWVFGQLSILGLIANVLVVPLVPLAMLLTLMAGIAGIWWMAVAGWIAWPGWLVLRTITEVVQWLASVPWAAMPLSITSVQLGVLYGCIGLVVVAMRHHTGHTFRDSRNLVE